jgi:hypothetical protein
MYCVQVSGVLHNTGQSLVFRPETGPKHSLAVNVSAGPLAYRYQIEEVFLHYGTDNSHGSEHRIQGSAFPAEVKRNPPLHFFSSFSLFISIEPRPFLRCIVRGYFILFSLSNPP